MATIENRIVNGGFEAGLSGWVSLNVTIVGSPANEGFAAARLNGGALNSFLSQSVSANPGDNFELIVSIARDAGGTVPVTSASVIYYGAGNAFLGYGLIENIVVPDTAGQNYQTVYGTTSPAPAGTVQAKVVINRLPATGTAAILVDQIALLQKASGGLTIIPVVNRYYYNVSTDLDLSAPASIPAALFTDDNGNPVAAFAGLGPNGYNNLFINGMLQEGNAYSVSPNALTLSAQPGGATIYSGTPITLETFEFFAQAT